MIDRYAREIKGWPKEDYDLWYVEDIEVPGRNADFWVVYSDDLAGTNPGGGESIVLVIDLESHKVVQELGFQ